MVRNLECLRCNEVMEYIKSEKIQLGQNSLIFGDLPNYIAGSLEVDVYTCNKCGKIEFFQMEEDQIMQIECPNCGKVHDMDYPKCPFCKNDYNDK